MWSVATKVGSLPVVLWAVLEVALPPGLESAREAAVTGGCLTRRLVPMSKAYKVATQDSSLARAGSQ
jgi:hypothetical protein